MIDRPPALMFGVSIDDVTIAETVNLIGRLVEDGRATGRTHRIATVNVDFLVNAIDDESIRAILQETDVCIADGMPVVWGARALGMPIAERVAGADLVPRLIDESRRTGHHVHFFGSSTSTIDLARPLVEREFPGANCTFQLAPVIQRPDDVDDETLDELADVDADVLCVALGNPKQERFIQSHHRRLRTPVMIGVGGSLDMLVGRRKRAPNWVGRIGMEWVFRAAQEPRRLGARYSHDLRVFAPRLVTEMRTARSDRRHPDIAVSIDGDRVTVVDSETPDPAASWAHAAHTLAEGGQLVVDLARTTGLCRPALARLVGLVRAAKHNGQATEWIGAGVALRKSFATAGLTSTQLDLPT